MDSEIDSWLINPQSIVSNRLANEDIGNDSSGFIPPSYIQQTTDESFLNTSGFGGAFDLDAYPETKQQSQAQSQQPPPQQQNTGAELNNFDLNYSDIDNLLTQELKELDIPLAPDQTENAGEFDWRQNILASPKQFQSQHSRKPSLAQSRLHKRGLSGTAIFGFANHNKTLSISSIQRTIQDMSKDPNIAGMLKNTAPSGSPSSIEAGQQPQYAQANTKPGNATNDELNRLILDQQETLRLELDRQREVNRKLEMQLRENQLQQEKLQRVLNDQTPGRNSTSPLRQLPAVNGASPARNTSPLRQAPSTAVTTPARLPPADEKLIITSNSATGTYQFPPPSTSPVSSSAQNGSPSRGFHNRGRNPQAPVTVPVPNLQLDSPREYIPAPPAPVFHTGYRSPDRERPAQQLFTPPSRSANGNAHAPRTSVLSTASTIPQPEETASTQGQAQGQGQGLGLFGLGLDLGGSTPAPQPVGLAPIPGSTENTPVKCRLPQKATFQHTPVKQTTMSSNTHAHVTPVTVERDSEGRVHLPNPMEYTPSPTKITRKPTTLPPGSIDHYVKELPDKLFKCVFPGCGKVFKRRYNVRSHIQTHLQDRPYSCQHPGCGKSFVRNHDLLRHQKTHGAKTWGCLCGKRFVKESSLQAHRAKMGCAAAHSSPAKENISRDRRGYVLSRMDEDLAGMFRAPEDIGHNSSMLLTPSPASFSDLDSL